MECYEEGPGDNAGLKAGDIISGIDGTDITEKDVSEVVDMIRGSGKEKVVLTVHRQNVENAMEVTVEITDVELPSVFSEMLENQTGYIRISQLQTLLRISMKKRFLI